MKKLLPDRHPNRDFFVADIFDAIPKDDLGSMEHPMFSLSKKPDTEIRRYEHNGVFIEIIPSVKGLATIWDKDILIYCVSQLIAGINRGQTPSQTIHVTAYDLLSSTNRHTGGKNYEQLADAFTRLRSTEIRTNIETNDERDRQGFGFIENWRILQRSKEDDRMVSVEIKLSDWLYRAILGTEVLSIHPDYFRLRGGIERRLYEIARKHCGNQSKWMISTPLLHKKSGARSPLKRFRFELKEIVSADHLPDYRLKFDEGKDKVTFYNRNGNKAGRAYLTDFVKETNQGHLF